MGVGDAGARAALDDERLPGFTGDRVLDVGEWRARGRRIVEATIAPGHRAPERVAPQLDLLRTAEAREGERA